MISPIENCRVLLVEDHVELAHSVIEFLETAGLTVDYARHGMMALSFIQDQTFDVMVVDISIPKLDGLSLCRRLRQEAMLATPIILLTARDTLEDKLEGFAAGADDYVLKPVALPELLARIQALVRRRRGLISKNQLQVQDLFYDLQTQQVSRQNQNILLAPTSLAILKVLMRESPKIVTRQALEHELWGDSLPDSDALRSHLYSLRKAIDKPFTTKLLHTLPGLGFKIE
jgi:DNA-binding response OmpR family regulator